MTIYPPVELTLLEVFKETDHKVRWDAFVDDAKFQLYIPKWRVPSPWPKKIRVTISPVSDDTDVRVSKISSEDRAADPSLAKKPIDAIVERNSSRTKTVRYDPVGEQSDWEIGSPYIPNSLTYDAADRLRLSVEWLESN